MSMNTAQAPTVAIRTIILHWDRTSKIIGNLALKGESDKRPHSSLGACRLQRFESLRGRMRPAAKPNLSAYADRSHDEGDDREDGDYEVVGPIDHTGKERGIEAKARSGAGEGCHGRDDRQRAYQYRFYGQCCLRRVIG